MDSHAPETSQTFQLQPLPPPQTQPPLPLQQTQQPRLVQQLLPPLGARFETWRALPVPSNANDLANYCHEIINIFQTIHAIGAELGRDLSLTQETLCTTQETLLTTQNQLQATNDEITLLLEELGLERHTVQALTRALATMAPADTPAHPKTQDLPAPPKFNGHRVRLKAWKNSVNIKLNGHTAKLPSPQHQLVYVFGLLEGKASDQIQPYVLGTGINLVDVPALFTVLERAIGDPDPIGSATRALRALKQRSNDLSTYLAKFSHLAAEVPWDDRVKLDHFQEEMRFELKQALVHFPDVIILEEFIDQASEVEQKLPRLRTNPRNFPTNRASHHLVTSNMPVTAIRTSHLSFAAARATSMGLSSGRLRLTQEERDRRHTNGLCIVYVKGDHFIAGCLLRKNRPLALHAVSIVNPVKEGESGKVVSLA